MQKLSTWGCAAVLIVASGQTDGQVQAHATRFVDMGSSSTGPESGTSESAGSSPIQIAKARRQPSDPTPASASPASASSPAGESSGTTSPAGRPGGTTIFEDDFEAEALSGWGASGNPSAATNSSEHFSGRSSVMLKVGPSDAVNYRTEIVIRDKLGRMYANRDYCIRFAFKVKDWTDFPKWITLFQTHAIPANGDFSCPAGRNSISLVSGSGRKLSLAVIDKPVARRRGGAIAEIVHSQDLAMDRWYTAQFRFRPAFDAGGVIEAWIDGRKVFSQTGANMDINDQCGRPSEPYTHLKLGLYKERENKGSQTIYYDDFVLSESTECK